MQDYRAYVLGPDGHIQERIDLVCAGDDAAKELAKALVDGHGVELWHLDRKITDFKARN
jgi:predicted dinucleotide-binding enzyme